jgi:hypothetical protein
MQGLTGDELLCHLALKLDAERTVFRYGPSSSKIGEAGQFTNRHLSGPGGALQAAVQIDAQFRAAVQKGCPCDILHSRKVTVMSQ